MSALLRALQKCLIVTECGIHARHSSAVNCILVTISEFQYWLVASARTRNICWLFQIYHFKLRWIFLRIKWIECKSSINVICLKESKLDCRCNFIGAIVNVNNSYNYFVILFNPYGFSMSASVTSYQLRADLPTADNHNSQTGLDLLLDWKRTLTHLFLWDPDYNNSFFRKTWIKDSETTIKFFYSIHRDATCWFLALV